MLEISITQIMVMLDLLTKSWLGPQLLAEWCVPNKTTNVLFTQTNLLCSAYRLV
jgi:hypothetical protein